MTLQKKSGRIALFLAFMVWSLAGLSQHAAPVSQSKAGQPFQYLPDRRDVVLYQVNMRVFSKDGNFQGVIDRLDSIRAMGTNVIYLMPHYPVGKIKSVNSPYCIQDYKAVNPEFGTLQDLKRLIDEAHVRKMAVILDWVANHTSYDHVWIKNKSWYLQDSTGAIISPPGTGWNDVAQLNFSNADMRREMIAAMKYWILETNADGFRCDYSDGPPVDFWKQALDTLKSMPGRNLLLLSEGRRSEHYKIGFDYNFAFEFFSNMVKIFEHGRSARTIDTLNIKDYIGASDDQRIVRYTSNHDVNGSEGTPLELFGGEKGSMAAFVVASLMKSVPMIYGGQEVGTQHRLTFPFTSTKINWDANPELKAEYKRIISFRNNSAALRRGRLTSYTTDDVVAFEKTLKNEKVVVIVNMRGKVTAYNAPKSLQKTKWVNAINYSKVKLPDVLNLEPYSYLILKK